MHSLPEIIYIIYYIYYKIIYYFKNGSPLRNIVRQRTADFNLM